MRDNTLVKIVILLGVLIFSVPAFAKGIKPILREERRIVIDGVQETWRLEWLTSPNPVCGPEDEYWNTCPCIGFTFGEWGDLRLVRKRPGKKDELFSLNTLFEYSGALPTPAGVSGTVLRRWDETDDDFDSGDSPGFADQVRVRPLAEVMRFSDYDHDGRATEFLLQIESVPCGKKMCVAVGVSRKNNRLHAFSSVRHPKKPLILTSWQWEALSKAKGPVKVLNWTCGDHGNDAEEEVELQARNGKISAVMRTYQCVGAEEDKRGRLLKKKVF